MGYAFSTFVKNDFTTRGLAGRIFVSLDPANRSQAGHCPEGARYHHHWKPELQLTGRNRKFCVNMRWSIY